MSISMRSVSYVFMYMRGRISKRISEVAKKLKVKIKFKFKRSEEQSAGLCRRTGCHSGARCVRGGSGCGSLYLVERVKHVVLPRAALVHILHARAGIGRSLVAEFEIRMPLEIN